MYFQKDYVLRMIEMLGDMMKRLTGMVNATLAIGELDAIAKQACGLPLELIKNSDADSLAGLLSEAQRYLALELLFVELAINKKTQTDDALLPLESQIIAIAATLYDPDYMQPAAGRAARLLEKTLSSLPAPLLFRAASLMERAEKLAHAEDALFMALSEDPSAKDEIDAFYRRIEQLPDEKLLLCGLSREEIAEGRAELFG